VDARRTAGVVDVTAPAAPIPRATYRLQLNKAFTFADVEALAPYLGALGISHAYLSPILKARPGSMHGYDVVDPTQINPELGTIEDFRRMASALRGHGVGIVLDIVPNHMGIGGNENPYWLDVLEYGPESRYADWFDLDWTPAEPTLRDKVLVPFLGTSYGEALDQGRLVLKFDAERGAFSVWAEETHRLPIDPATYDRILGRGGDALASLVREFKKLDGAAGGEADVLKTRLVALCRADPNVAAEIAATVARHNGPGRCGELDALIARQHWRPARFTVAADDINYRRFFIVSDLAAIRVERPDVFDHFHALVFELVAEGLIDGLRIDHIDGLYDPKAYCLKLRRSCPRPIYLVVEKILAPHEMIRTDWQAEGTTGYEFGSAVTQLLTDPAGEHGLSRIYAEHTGEARTLAEEERRARLDIVDYEMAAELDALATRLRALAVRSRATADLTRNALRNALRHFVSNLPVYRTYVDADGHSAADSRNIAFALGRARRVAPAVVPAALDFVAAVACNTQATDSPDQRLDLARRIQQYTGPVMAKGLEDTALYRVNRLIALSDVGTPPDRYTRSVAAFHDFNRARLKRKPHGMLATSSHDSKRGEDTRARIVALSGAATEWEQAVNEWRDLLAAAGAPGIAANDRYYFFQMLVGAWPTEMPEAGRLDPARLAQFAERVDAAMLKSIREARLSTNWNAPRRGYEEHVKAYVATALRAGIETPFLERLRAFERRIGLSGAQCGLIQTTLNLTLPGVPDIYQGAELWEQSMVDPDNRRPVDFTPRRVLAAELPRDANIATLVPDWRSGRVKLALITRLLALRKERPDLFASGAYTPLAVEGPDADRVIAFFRGDSRQAVLVVALLGPWRATADARLTVPEALRGRWDDVLRGTSEALASRAPIGKLVDVLPVAVLVSHQP
jgi:(1->4)-alpha-D-glucan 1-alpha-D-glucosylmutase